MDKFKPIFSYFGNKRSIAPIVWKAFGKVDNYIEPFCGSLAVLLANPIPSKLETVNDIDYTITNFWRAVANDVEKVEFYSDAPVNEADLHAKQIWLLNQLTPEFKKRMHEDIDFYDAKVAGYWIWGKSCSIANNWLDPKGLTSTPVLSSAGEGINGRTTDFKELFAKLQKRLRLVRVCCGDWKRVVTPSVTFNNKAVTKDGYAAIFLDPPYSSDNRNKVYNNESNIYKEVCDWAVNNYNEKLKIAVCGYEGDYIFPDNWIKYSWSTNGGMSSLAKGVRNVPGKTNSSREMIYFSPNCNILT